MSIIMKISDYYQIKEVYNDEAQRIAGWVANLTNHSLEYREYDTHYDNYALQIYISAKMFEGETLDEWERIINRTLAHLEPLCEYDPKH